jgi:hypothetical protein
MLAGYAAARSEGLVDQLRIVIDAIDADGWLRITAAAMVRLCPTRHSARGAVRSR